MLLLLLPACEYHRLSLVAVLVCGALEQEACCDLCPRSGYIAPKGTRLKTARSEQPSRAERLPRMPTRFPQGPRGQTSRSLLQFFQPGCAEAAVFWFGVRGQRGAAFSSLPSLWASTNVPLTCELVGDNRGPSRLTAELRHRGGKDLGAVELWSGAPRPWADLCSV